jgi:hypothetical protein
LKKAGAYIEKCISDVTINLKSNVSKYLDVGMLRYHQVSMFSSSSAGCLAFNGHASLLKDQNFLLPLFPLIVSHPDLPLKPLRSIGLYPALWALNMCHGGRRHLRHPFHLDGWYETVLRIRDPRPSNQSSISVLLGMCKLGVGQEFVMRRARYWCVRYQADSRFKIETVDERRIWVSQRNEDLVV